MILKLFCSLLDKLHWLLSRFGLFGNGHRLVSSVWNNGMSTLQQLLVTCFFFIVLFLRVRSWSTKRRTQKSSLISGNMDCKISFGNRTEKTDAVTTGDQWLVVNDCLRVFPCTYLPSPQVSWEAPGRHCDTSRANERPGCSPVWWSLAIRPRWQTRNWVYRQPFQFRLSLLT